MKINHPPIIINIIISILLTYLNVVNEQKGRTRKRIANKQEIIMRFIHYKQ